MKGRGGLSSGSNDVLAQEEEKLGRSRVLQASGWSRSRKKRPGRANTVRIPNTPGESCGDPARCWERSALALSAKAWSRWRGGGTPGDG